MPHEDLLVPITIQTKLGVCFIFQGKIYTSKGDEIFPTLAPIFLVCPFLNMLQSLAFFFSYEVVFFLEIVNPAN